MIFKVNCPALRKWLAESAPECGPLEPHCCCYASIDGETWVCTRIKDHPGIHVGHIGDNYAALVWNSQDEDESDVPDVE